MKKTISCFVIIGYGKKRSYATGKLRELDLDETFTLLIKPVFEALNIDCYRAIDKNLTGSIDKVMLEEIKNADIALVDISTLNANVLWELGVRHALKPHYTIMICEKAQMSSLPFDINHFPIHQYSHAEEGIPYKEVKRFREHLTNVVKGVLAQEQAEVDSPVHTYLKNVVGNNAEEDLKTTDSLATIMEKAEKAKKQSDYPKALKLLTKAKYFASNNMTLKDNLPLIISRQALCTYKSKDPNEIEALEAAQEILYELNPMQSMDTEVLGLSGAIHKRQYEITKRQEHLEDAIGFYEKGFHFKQDYYNGINAVFMNYIKADILKSEGEEWFDIKLTADYIRNRVLNIALKLENEPNFIKSKDAIWVLLTIAECYNYKRNTANQKEYEEKAEILAKSTKDEFAMGSYNDQKEKINQFYDTLK